jgi:flagellar M-ring protein FliF
MADAIPTVTQAEILPPSAPGGSFQSGRQKLEPMLGSLSGVLSQPAVRKSIPLLIGMAMIGAVFLVWWMVSTPNQRMLFQGLEDGDKAAISESLNQAGIQNRIDNQTGTLTVAEDDYYRARMLLASQNLPKAAPGGYALLDQMPLGVSRAVEGERLKQARETELSRSIAEIDAVVQARVHLAVPEASVFVRDAAAPSASVVVKLATGRSLSEAQVKSIINLVASSVPGLKPQAVTVVDQAGDLLTRGDTDPMLAASEQRIAFQRRIESKYREQLAQLMTPLVGADAFTAEVQAEVDLDESQATREVYDKDGAALRSEQGAWTGNKSDAEVPQGIPGALSNTPPPATQVSAAPEHTVTPTPPQSAVAQAGSGSGSGSKTSENYARNFELNRQISVTRATPGQVKRLSVAVVLRDTAGAKKRTAAEMEQLTSVVRAAVGFQADRGDQVTVISREFSGAAALDQAAPWYEAPWLAMVARNLAAVAVAALLIFGALRPLARGVMRRRDAKQEADAKAALAGLLSGPGASSAPGGGSASSHSAPVSIDMLDNARSYDDRVQLVRAFTRDNPARAALAIRDMMRADNKAAQ